ncbi:MAG: hypothetical protein IPK79_13560 [Vampirovibrionales bacterium]|jgi:hypothetical protein|nr:hypothetical protein [Candidatus Competibacteraceae bacterium]MBK8191459.1 hypothetical protein [Vampirovibrionales bacterium]
MAKKVEDHFLDAYLNQLDNCTTLHVTSAEPANHAGIAAVTLANVTLTAGAGNGDYTIANGDTSGRKLTVAQQASISITGSGTATHVVLTDATNIWMTTCTSQALTSGGTVTVNAFDVEIADPT